MQLLGKFDPSVSFAARPLVGKPSATPAVYSMIDSIPGMDLHSNLKPGPLALLPFSIVQQLNTHHPYGWNDGPMISANGYQVYATGGAYFGTGSLEIELQPEFVYATNSAYERNIDYGSNTGGSYLKIFPGQSTIRLSTGNVSAGVSTASLWWGPGQRSSLLMSNNAPGFLHVFFSSRKPVQTGIGSFEWQLIGGKLTSDNDRVYENYFLRPVSLSSGWRYLNAYVVSYQPKWIPGLFLGMTRSLQRYKTDIDKTGGSIFSKYLPVVTKAFQKKNALNDDSLHTDQLASFFLRWVLPKAYLEFYLEYGYNDYNQNIRDYLLGPTHSAAYLAGIKKVIPLKGNSYLDLGFEVTQMSQSPEYLVREAGNWYVHGEILQGYTHQNQILGAGAGQGSNVQTLTATWIDGWKQLGILFERVERDPQYHPNKWSDISIGILPQWKLGSIVLSGLVQGINSRNYAWTKDSNRFNLHTQVGVHYFFR